MAEITAALVKELRQNTGAGMMDCKKALTEMDGDLEAAVDWLRKNGLAAAAKKAGRVAAEGLVGVVAEGTRGAAVEVNSETDFVARNETFQNFVGPIAGLALEAGGDLETLGAAPYPGGGNTVAETLTELIATMGENMSLRRTAVLQVADGVVASYVHKQVAPGLGTIGVLVALESRGDKNKLSDLGKRIAMHIAWAAPRVIDVGDVDAAALDRERKVLAEQARISGKPENIIEKMVEGRLRKYYEEICLLEQVSAVDNESKIRKVIEQTEQEAGAPIAVADFLRYQLGEGIERD